MNDLERRIDTRGLTNGLLLIVIGALFLLDRLHVVDIGDLLRMYWPLTIIFFGTAQLLRRESFWWGVWTVVTGIWCQSVNLRLFGLTYRNSWPLLLIALGAAITLRALFEMPAPKEERNGQ